MRTFKFAAAILAAAVACDCHADDTGKATTVPNDVTNYQGDRVSFNEDIIATIQRADGTAGKKVCLPAHLKLRGGVGYTVSGSGGSNTVETGTLFRLLKPLKLPSDTKAQTDNELPQGIIEKIGGSPPVKLSCNANTLPDDKLTVDFTSLTPGVDLRVSKDTLDRAPPNRYGLTYGALAIPFKYHLTGAKDFTGSATVGPYVGYRTQSSSNGFGISGILFLGASNISVPQTGGGSQNLAGVSYGFGAIATLKGNFQLGGVFGFDRVSSNAGYQYNGKIWTALELGYSFLQ